MLRVRLIGERVAIEWDWQALRQWLDMIELQVDRSDGIRFVFLTHDTTPGYTDTASATNAWAIGAMKRRSTSAVDHFPACCASYSAQNFVTGVRTALGPL